MRTLITIFWDMAVFFRLMLLMLLTFVFAFLLRPGKSTFGGFHDASRQKRYHVFAPQRLYDQPFSVVGIGEMMWYVYVHGVFGDADPPPGGADAWQILTLVTQGSQSSQSQTSRVKSFEG